MATVALRPEVSATWEYWKNIRLRNAEEPERVSIPLPEQSLPTSLEELIDNPDLSTHEISLLSGISPAYLSASKRGIIKKVGREKLLVLSMIAHNMSMKDTNAILAVHGYKSVDELDATPLIEASLKKTVKGFQIVRTNLSLTLLHLSIESLRGDTVTLHKMPEPALIPINHWPDAIVGFSNETDRGLGKYVHRKRIELFNESLERGEGRYSLMCEHCLRQHLASYKKGGEESKGWIIDHLRNAVETLSRYDNFRIDLLNACQRHWFRMKLIPRPEDKNSKVENSKVVFVGRASAFPGDRDTVGDGYKDLAQMMESDPVAIRAFATDNKKILRQFLTDLDWAISKSVIPVADMPSYLAKLVKEETGATL